MQITSAQVSPRPKVYHLKYFTNCVVLGQVSAHIPLFNAVYSKLQVKNKSTVACLGTFSDQ